MIKSATIKEFQSHRETTFKFSPGVNLFIGQSDSGKSAILRALKWLATNRPLGDGFKSWDGKGDTSVSVLLAGGDEIEHQVGYYAIQPKEGAGMEWSAIGTTVPETVSTILNISELSWQSQMDAPFLLSSSPGEVARMLNEVADLDKIDSALVNINRMARDNRTQLTATAAKKQQLEIDLSAYRELDGQLKKVSQLKEMNRKADALETLVASGTEILADIVKLNEKLSHVRNTADAEEMLDGLMDMMGQLKGAENQVSQMEAQLSRIKGLDMRMKDHTERLSRLEGQWHARSKGRCPLCGRL